MFMSVVNKSTNFVYYLIAFLLLEVMVTLFLWSNYRLQHDALVNKYINEQQYTYEIITNLYGVVADTIYNEVINQPDIIALYQQAYMGEATTRQAIRETLYQQLAPAYTRLQQKNLRQLHFHLPDGTSFLRFHRPEKYGDSLLEVRYSVRLANTLKKPVQGFEEGRVFNGFRYVFPLFAEQTHIGSVEASIAFRAVNQEMNAISPQQYFDFMIKKSVMQNKVWNSERSHYESTRLSDQFVTETLPETALSLVNSPIALTRIKRINNLLWHREIDALLEREQAFLQTVSLADKDYIITFTPILNIQQEVAAYIVGYQENSALASTTRHFHLQMLLFTLGNTLLLGFIFNLSHNKQLAEQREADIRDSEEMFRQVSATSLDAIIVMDSLGKVVFWNPAAEQIFGYSAAEITGHDLHELISPAYYRDQQAVGLAAFQATGQGQYLNKVVELVGQRKNGAHFPAEVSITSVYLKNSWHAVGTVRDISERKATEQELRKLSRAVEQSASSIVITGLDGCIEFVNPAFCANTGYTPTEVLGNNPSILKSGLQEADIYQQLWHTLESGDVWKGELANKRKNGEIFWEFATISPIKDATGTATHYLAIKEDITQRKMVEAQLKNQNIELRLKNEQLDAFTRQVEALQAQKLYQLNQAYERFMPHQFLKLLSKASVTEVELGDQIEQEMTILFADIRDFTTLSENMTPQETFNFINEYLRQMEPIIRQYGGFIDKYIGDAIMALFPEADAAVQAGIEMLNTLQNYNVNRLSDNKTPIQIGIGINTGALMLGTVGGEKRMDGTVISDAVNLASRLEGLTKTYHTAFLISQSTLARLPDPAQYRIRLLDNVRVKGKSEIVTIYEVFDASEAAQILLKQQTLTHFESGVKLFHDKQYQKAYQVFEKVLALSQQDEPAHIYLQRCEQALNLTAPISPTVLVVDDSPSNVKILYHLLRRYGFEVLVAENGESAIKIAEQSLPHLILLDVMMPEMDGFTTCTHLKQQRVTQAIPVIFITALDETDYKIKGFHLGAVDYVTKPFQQQELLARVNTHINLRHMHQQLQERLDNPTMLAA